MIRTLRVAVVTAVTLTTFAVAAPSLLHAESGPDVLCTQRAPMSLVPNGPPQTLKSVGCASLEKRMCLRPDQRARTALRTDKKSAALSDSCASPRRG